jgi:uncharacterized protein YggU (UPF0235/DUF167 family)
MRVIVHAKPRARENRIEELPSPPDRPHEIHLAVSVTEPPIQGRANNAICRLVGERYKVPYALVRIVSGFTSRTKILEW